MRAFVALNVFSLSLLLSGCFSLEATDGGPDTFDGGTIDVSRRDSGPVNPPQDAGPPPQPDAGTPPTVAITSFAADTTSLAFLSSTNLRWTVSAASSCALDPDLGPVMLSSGSVTIDAGNPGDAVTYRLTCQGNGGPVTAQTTVTTVLVQQPGAVVDTIAELGAFAGVNIVTGNLTIENIPGLTDLSAIERLVEVEGNLIVRGNPALTTLNLPNLTRVGGVLGVDKNGALTTVALPAITRVESKLYFARNLQLPQTEIDAVVTTLQGAEGIGGAVVDFYDDPTTVLDSLNQTMVCTHSSLGGLFLLEFTSFGFDVYEQQTQVGWVYVASGTYDENLGQLRMSSGAFIHGTTQTSSTVEVEYDRLTVFQSAEFSMCWITSIPGQGAIVTATFQCPFVASGAYEDRNSFVVSLEGQARWDRTVVTIGTGSQQTDSLTGAFLVDNDWLLFAFPPSQALPNTPRYLTGRVNAAETEIHMEELGETMNPCVLQ